jgi:hypothetical protein
MSSASATFNAPAIGRENIVVSVPMQCNAANEPCNPCTSVCMSSRSKPTLIMHAHPVALTMVRSPQMPGRAHALRSVHQDLPQDTQDVPGLQDMQRCACSHAASSFHIEFTVHGQFHSLKTRAGRKAQLSRARIHVVDQHVSRMAAVGDSSTGRSHEWSLLARALADTDACEMFSHFSDQSHRQPRRQCA